MIVLSILGFTSNRNAKRIVNEIEISFSNEDNLFLTGESVDNLLVQNNGYVKSQLKSLINLQELEQVVQQHPMISKSEISLDILGNLEVEIEQRKPIARVFDYTGSFYLDTQGEKMPMSNHYSARVLMVDNRNGFIKNEEVFPLVQKIANHPFLTKTIIMVKRDQEGFWLQTRVNKQKVLLGTLDKLNQKLKKLEVFYNYAGKDSLAKTFTRINLQYNNQVVCKK